MHTDIVLMRSSCSTMTTIHLLLVCVFLAASRVDSAAVPTDMCPAGYFRFRNRCYSASASQESVCAAQAACKAQGGYLVDVQSDDLNKFLRDLNYPALSQCDRIGNWNHMNCEESRFYFCETALNCPDGYVRYGSSCYYFSTDSKTWDDAASACTEYQGSYIVEIEDDDENSFLVNTANTNEVDYWIGGTDKAHEGSFKWYTSNTDVTGGVWEPGNPSDSHTGEDCMEIHDQDVSGPALPTWNDKGCWVSQRFICERPSKGIELYRIVPNDTHLMQPLDKGLFGPLKARWYQIFRKHNRDNPGTVINKMNFAEKLKDVRNEFYKPSILVNSFAS